MAVKEDMDICLNIAGRTASPQKTTSQIINDMCVKKLSRPSVEKVKRPFKKFQSTESSKGLLTGAKKRIKQKSLATIVSNNIRIANPSTALPKRSILKKSTAIIPNKHLKPLTKKKTGADVKPLNQNSESIVEKTDNEKSHNLISFTKHIKDISIKTILAKKRKLDVDKSKKTLSNIFNSGNSTEVKLLQSNDDADNKLPCKVQKTEGSDDVSNLNLTMNFTRENKSDENLKKPRAKFEKSSNPKNEMKKKYTQSHFQQNTKLFSLFSNNPSVPNIGQRFVKPVNEAVFTAEKFSELGIHTFSVSNLEQNMNITTMTTVQKKAIPVILSGRDILVRSQTGSGKTLSYALPIIEKLQSIRPKVSRMSGIHALIVLPTRELALQTYECFLKLIKPFTWVVPGYLVGGEKRKAEKARLRKGCNILVVTPGRLLDHVKHTKALKLDSIKYFVLDEADRMFDMGYEKDISEIVDVLTNRVSESSNSEYDAMNLLRQHINPNSNKNENKDSDNEEEFDNNLDDKAAERKIEIAKMQYHSDTDEDNNYERNLVNSEEVLTSDNKADNKKEESTSSDVNNIQKRQTILLSATLTHAVEKLAGLTMHNPVFVDAAKDNVEASGGSRNDINEDLVVPQSVVQSYVVTPPKLRMVTLSAYLAGKCRNEGNHKILIFMATQDMIDYHAHVLSSILNQPVDDEDEDSDPLVNIEFFKLHGNMAQKDRTEVFKTFKKTNNGVLLCTDVAARGLDVPKVDTVIQYTAPTSTQDYVHRIGRTGRAGSSGTAIVFLTPPEVEFARMLESRRIRIKQEDMDNILGGLLSPLSPQSSVREAAVELQNKFEDMLLEDKKLYATACKAYTSWVRFYSSYPRPMRDVFNRKNLHLGHYAKSFALRDPPQKIGGTGKLIKEKEVAAEPRPKHDNRLANKRADGVARKRADPKHPEDRRLRMLRNVRMLNTSEYDSGLEPLKKPKKS